MKKIMVDFLDLLGIHELDIEVTDSRITDELAYVGLENEAGELAERTMQYLCEREITEDMPDEFFEHTYRAMKDYGMSVYDADKWAWLNTLFGYDIGADKALGLITWYDDNGMDVLELTSDSKDALRNVAEIELGFHFNYTAFAPYTPDAISYTWPDHI